MSDFPDIIHTAVIQSQYDALWERLPNDISGETSKEVVIISIPYAQESSEEIQLQKMMQACKLQPEQYVVIPVNEEQLLPWHQVRDSINPKVILLLGVHPHQLGISALLHLYAPNRFNDCIWIAAPSLAAMEQQAEAKKQLWNTGLKPVFVDKTMGNI